MASANDPSASHVQSQPNPPGGTSPQETPAGTATVPTEPKDRIPLPPPPLPPRTPMTPETLRFWTRQLDWSLVALVLLLAFFVGSFLATNSDAWQHLAAGRLIAHGEYPWGRDPFTYTSADRPWVNTSWLTDLGAYALFTAAGGEAGAGGVVLVLVKALLIALLAEILLHIRRPALGLWAPAVCTALALVVMAPRLLLQPTAISFLFLGLTLYLLQRTPVSPESSASRWFRWTGGRAWVVLPILFAFWVNLDSWFFLGPVTVLLYLLGGLLRRVANQEPAGPDEPRAEELPRLAAVLLIGVAACLLNPYHVRVFTTLPSELLAWRFGPELQSDRWFESYYQSPFHELYRSIYYDEGLYTSALQGRNVAGFAYFALVLVGLVSFALNPQGLASWRLLVWLPFAVLSGLLIRTVPFFAIVAAPVSALNLQDYAVRQFGVEPRVSGGALGWALGGRALSILAALVVLLGAWPGWLTTRILETDSLHRVAWGMKVNPSVHAMAERLQQLRAEGALADGEHGFNFSPDLGSYWSWFAPGERCFCDFRIQLSPETAATYVQLRRALPLDPFAALKGDQPPEPINWQEIFGRYHIKYVALSANDPPAFRRTLGLWEFPEERVDWRPFYADGQTTLFSYRSPALVAHELNLERLALDRATGDRAPDEGPDRPPHVDDFWDVYASAPAPVPLDCRRAELYVRHYKASQDIWKGLRDPRPRVPTTWLEAADNASWMIFGTELAGMAATGSGPLPVQATIYGRTGNIRLQNGFLTLWPMAREPLWWALLPREVTRFPNAVAPPGAPLLAIRAARRAIKANPDCADCYWQLASAYQALWFNQEQFWVRQAPDNPQRVLLREAQLAAALHRTVLLAPKGVEAQQMRGEAHQMMADLIFRQLGFVDLEQEHLQKVVEELGEERPTLSDVLRETNRQMVDKDRKRLDDLERQVKERTSSFVVQATNKPAREKVQIAINLGLAKKALEILEQFDPDEAKGDAPDLREKLIQFYLRTGRVDEAKSMLPSTDAWDAIQIAAAQGDYKDADAHLRDLLRVQQVLYMRNTLQLIRYQTFGTVNPMNGSPQPQYMLQTELGRVARAFRSAPGVVEIRGLLALEAGDIKTAEKSFDEVLQQRDTGPRMAPSVVALLADRSPISAFSVLVMANQGPGFPFEPSPIAVNYLLWIRTVNPKKE